MLIGMSERRKIYQRGGIDMGEREGGREGGRKRDFLSSYLVMHSAMPVIGRAWPE